MMSSKLRSNLGDGGLGPIPRCVVVIAAMLMALMWAVIPAPCGWAASSVLEGTQEILTYVLKDPRSKAVVGHTEIRIERDGSAHRWFEQRRYQNDVSDTFNVTFEPQTLLPITYTREQIEKGRRTVVQIKVVGESITATITSPPGKVRQQVITRPKEIFVVEPFLKYYLSRVVAENLTEGKVSIVTMIGDDLADFGIRWRVRESAQIQVPAGHFNCVVLAVEPQNWLMRMVAPRMLTYLDAQGTHKVIRSPVRRSLFDTEKISELKAYDLHRP